MEYWRSVMNVVGLDIMFGSVFEGQVEVVIVIVIEIEGDVFEVGKLV